ncbi:hypothetical protein ABBQ32_004722 [Trebouxia sp. C0010 RCD-2024]
MAKDRQWLRQRLCTALGWDQIVVEGVVEAIASAESAKEVDALVQVASAFVCLSRKTGSRALSDTSNCLQDYMGGGAQPKQLVQEFVQAQGKGFATPGNRQGGASAQPAGVVKPAAEVQTQHTKRGAKDGQRQGGALTIKHTAARKGKGPAGKAGPPGSDLERKVVNCLSCGKVYDFRLAGAGQLTNDLLRFLEYGGLCTFCGAQVALSYNEQSQTNTSQTPAVQPSTTPEQVPNPIQPASSSCVQAVSNTNQQDESKEADAVAFKNRLVGYDRNAAQRTKVIDDQSDYFEIDSNTWLSREERDQLKARARDEAAALEARKNKVTVTVDLLGRQVLMSDSPEAQQLEASTSMTQSSAKQPASEAPSTSASSATAAAASGPTPQSGSHAMRIASNPNLRGPPPMFVKQAMQQLADGAGSSYSDQAQSLEAGGARAAGSAQQPRAEGQPHDGSRPPGKGKQAKGMSRQRTNRPPRLQHDDPFLAYDITVA